MVVANGSLYWSSVIGHIAQSFTQRRYADAAAAALSTNVTGPRRYAADWVLAATSGSSRIAADGDYRYRCTQCGGAGRFRRAAPINATAKAARCSTFPFSVFLGARRSRELRVSAYLSLPTGNPIARRAVDSSCTYLPAMPCALRCATRNEATQGKAQSALMRVRATDRKAAGAALRLRGLLFD